MKCANCTGNVYKGRDLNPCCRHAPQKLVWQTSGAFQISVGCLPAIVNSDLECWAQRRLLGAHRALGVMGHKQRFWSVLQSVPSTGGENEENCALDLKLAHLQSLQVGNDVQVHCPS